MKRQLLVVDDDSDILKVLKANLELYGFDTMTAGNCAEASKVLSDHLPDIIILDLMLPDGDGVQLCKSIKERYPKLPIIMLTAKDSVSDKVLGFESGTDDYIVKPFETLELIARIKACLKRTAPVEEKVAINDLSIDLKLRIVKLKNKEVELTPKEYNLLCLFISNRGEIITREFIRKKIWKDAKPYSWSRVIDVHIQHLRHKIEKNPSEPEYILTVPGVGYKFRP